MAFIQEEQREALIQKYSTTPEGRAKLAISTFNPAQIAMEIVTNDPLQIHRAEFVITNMERIHGMMTGEEDDATIRKFGSLLEGLQMLRDEIRGKVVFKKLR